MEFYFLERIVNVTIPTLYMLPLLLSISNSTKVFSKSLITGRKVTKEEVERATTEDIYVGE